MSPSPSQRPCISHDVAPGSCALSQLISYLRNTLKSPRSGERSPGLSSADLAHPEVLSLTCPSPPSPPLIPPPVSFHWPRQGRSGAGRRRTWLEVGMSSGGTSWKAGDQDSEARAGWVGKGLRGQSVLGCRGRSCSLPDAQIKHRLQLRKHPIGS